MAYICKICEKPVPLGDETEREEKAWRHLYIKHRKEFDTYSGFETEDMMEKCFTEDDKVKCKEN